MVELHRRLLLDAVLTVGLPIAALIVVWEIGARIVLNPSMLPSPAETLGLTYTFLITEGPRGHTAVFHLEKTVVRVAIASAIGLVLSTVFGIAMATNRTLEEGLSDWLPFWMTIPTVVIILVSMIWFRFSELSILFAVVVASVPFGTVNLWEGMRDVDASLVEMARAFDASNALVWHHVYVPHLMPYVFGSYRYILGMVWKIVALAEIFGIQNGIGAMFRFWYGQGSVVALLAYLVIFVAVMLFVEYGVLKPVEDRVFAWRESGG